MKQTRRYNFLDSVYILVVCSVFGSASTLMLLTLLDSGCCKFNHMSCANFTCHAVPTHLQQGMSTATFRTEATTPARCIDTACCCLCCPACHAGTCPVTKLVNVRCLYQVYLSSFMHTTDNALLLWSGQPTVAVRKRLNIGGVPSMALHLLGLAAV